MTMNGTEQLVANNESLIQEGVKAAEPTESWTSVLPESYRNDPNITKYKSIEDFVQGYKSASELIGKSVRLPDPNNKEEMGKFYQKLGRPETPDKYSVNDDLKKMMQEDGLKEFLSVAHEAGLTGTQLDAVTKYYVNMETKKSNLMAEERTKSETELKKMWGEEYNSKLLQVGNVLKAYSAKYGQDAVKQLSDNIGNNVPLIVMLHDLSLSIKGSKEDVHVQGTGSTTFSGLSSDEAKSKIKDIRDNLTHPYHNSRDKDHSKAVQEMQELYSAAYKSV